MSDPSARRMTEEQWHVEYHALRMREEQDQKTLEQTLIKVLGLNIRPDDNVPFVPLSILLAQPETLKLMQRWNDTAVVARSIEEEDSFEKMSKMLAEGAELASDDDRDDMQPLITEAQRKHEEALALFPVREVKLDGE